MLPAAYAQYRTVSTQTASPGELLLQLYQAAIKHAGLACAAIERADAARGHEHIMRVQDIVAELRRTLDFEKGGDVAANLERLYAYMQRRLMEGNVAKDRGPIEEVAGLLRQLLSAWQVAVRESGRHTRQPVAASAA